MMCWPKNRDEGSDGSAETDFEDGGIPRISTTGREYCFAAPYSWEESG